MDKQTRIFAHRDHSDALWYQNILGKIIKPVTEEFVADLDWFWFSRYTGAIPPNDLEENCIVANIPQECKRANDNHTRSVRFRYHISDEQRRVAFETAFEEAVNNEDCAITDYRPWDRLNDVGDNNHLGEQRTEERRNRRAEIIPKLYHQMSLLALDNLIEANNDFHFETNDSGHIPSPTSFGKPHHIFCNLTRIPLQLWITLTQQNNTYSATSKSNWSVPDGNVLGRHQINQTDFWVRIEANF